MTIRVSNICDQRGFTLLEVMVALLIIALSLTGMAVTMGAMLDNATSLRERTYASWIAQNKIVEIRASGVVPETKTTSGDIEYASSEWTWEATVSETGVEGLLRIDVAVSRPDADGEIRKVTGFVGEPTVPGMANRLWVGGSVGAGSVGAGGGRFGSGSGDDDDGVTD